MGRRLRSASAQNPTSSTEPYSSSSSSSTSVTVAVASSRTSKRDLNEEQQPSEDNTEEGSNSNSEPINVNKRGANCQFAIIHNSTTPKKARLDSDSGGGGSASIPKPVSRLAPVKKGNVTRRGVESSVPPAQSSTKGQSVLSQSMEDLIGPSATTGMPPSPSSVKGLPTSTTSAPLASSGSRSNSNSGGGVTSTTTTTSNGGQAAPANANPELTCPICGEERPTKGALRNHLEMHKGLKPCPCPFRGCGWAYETEVKVMEHCIIAHKSDAAFQCDRCQKKYKRHNALKSHELTVHGVSS